MQSSVAIEPEVRASIPIYVAGLGASAMGLVALKAVLSGGEFTSFAFTLIVIGYSMSWGVRARLVSNGTLAVITLITLTCTLAALIIEPEFRYQLITPDVLEAPDLLAAMLLASLMVAYSFRLATNRSVLFLCVPSLSLIGLLATADPSAEMFTYFGIYIACTSYALIRENALASPRANRASAGSIKLELGLTAGLTVAGLAFGALVGTLIYPLATRAFMSRMSDFDTTQLVEPAGEEFVPIATGPVTLSDQEILTVECNSPLLWREKTYNKYTGQGWSSSLLPQEQKWIHPITKRDESKLCTFKVMDQFEPRERSAVRMVKQTFHITRGVFKPVFAASDPEIISFEKWQPLLRMTAGLETGYPYRQGDTYFVTSKVSTASPRQLQTASNVYPEIIKARFLDIPQSCWQIKKLTSRIIETRTTPMQRAQAIQDYLSAEFTYDLNAPAAPADRDAITYFLLESKRGYCDIFASAMVVMSRQAGIPARWATGFASGEFDSRDHSYHVKAKDRHAWAELYFPEYGWIPFDVYPVQEGTDWVTRLTQSWNMVSPGKMNVLAGGLIFLLVAYLVKTELIDASRLNSRKSHWQCDIGATEIGRCFERMCRILGGYGYHRSTTMTPLEYASRTRGSIRLSEISEAVDFLTAGFVEFRYSDHEPAPEKVRAMKDNLQILARTLRKAKKEKLLARQ